MRSDVPLREITTQEIWADLQKLRTELQTHNHLTFGSQGLTGTVSGILQSPNFVSGSSGWQIKPDGTLEANSGNFRGDISGASGTFTGALSGATITGGTITLSTGGTDYFKVDTTGINDAIFKANSRLEIPNDCAVLMRGSATSYIDFSVPAITDINRLDIRRNVAAPDNNLVYIHSAGCDTSGKHAVLSFNTTGREHLLELLSTNQDGNAAHIRFLGDPVNNSPSDGDFWFDGANLKLRVTTITEILATEKYVDDNEVLGGLAIYGNGADGDVNINADPFSSGPITNNALTRDAFFDDLTLSGGDLDCAGYRLFYKGTLTINNGYKVYRSGNNGNNGQDGSGRNVDGNGGTGGTALSAGTLEGTVASTAGGEGGNGGSSGTGYQNGFNGIAGNADDKCISNENGKAGTVGGKGGKATNGPSVGGSGGAGGTTTEETNKPYSIHTGILMRNLTLTGIESYASVAGSGGSGGGGGGSYDAGSDEEGGKGGGGGGAGAPAGIMVICGKTLVNNGSIQAVGGDGGNGGNGYNRTDSGGGGGGAGGSGGNGGIIFLVYNSKSGNGTISVVGGSKGMGGTGGTGGSAVATNGNDGNNGTSGILIEIANI